MDIEIQFVQTESVDTAEQVVIEKLNKLSQKYQEIIRAEVFFKEEPGANKKGKICDVRLSLPGPRIFASSDEETMEAAAAETVRDLERQLRKRKD